MTARAIFQRAARAIVATVGEAIVFRGQDRTINTRATIARAISDIGFDARAGESRYQAELLVEDVGEPKRGDIVTDTRGRAWTLREEVANDDYIVTWSLER